MELTKKLPRVKILAVVLCVCLLAVPLLTLSASVVHRGHDCGGEHCEICLCLDRARALCKSLGALFLLILGAFCLSQVCLLLPGAFAAGERHTTPVALHVRMNH